METQVKVFNQSVKTLVLFFSFFGLIPQAKSNPVVQYWENRTGSHEGFVLDPRISYYSTSENYDSNSVAGPILNQYSVSRLYFDVNATYGFDENWFVFGRLSALSSKVMNPVTVDQSVFGLGDQLLGASHRLINTDSGFSLDLQLDMSFPAYNNSTQKANGDPYLGDGSTDITFGTFGEIPLPFGMSHDVYLEAGAGYTSRSKGYSSDVPWSLFLKRYPVAKGFVYSLGVRGIQSLKTDKTPPATAIVDQRLGAGGSYLINAVNPSWMIGQASIGMKTNSGDTIYAMLAYPFTGTNAPKGIQISAGFQIDFGVHRKGISENSPEEKALRRGHSNRFTTYDLEAKVTSVSDQFYLAKINKGMDDGVDKGQIFDIFKSSEDPVTQAKKETLVARAKVTNLKTGEAALTVIEYFIDQWIEPGFIARRELH